MDIPLALGEFVGSLVRSFVMLVEISRKKSIFMKFGTDVNQMSEVKVKVQGQHRRTEN